MATFQDWWRSQGGAPQGFHALPAPVTDWWARQGGAKSWPGPRPRFPKQTAPASDVSSLMAPPKQKATPAGPKSEPHALTRMAKLLRASSSLADALTPLGGDEPDLPIDRKRVVPAFADIMRGIVPELPSQRQSMPGPDMTQSAMSIPRASLERWIPNPAVDNPLDLAQQYARAAGIPESRAEMFASEPRPTGFGQQDAFRGALHDVLGSAMPSPGMRTPAEVAAYLARPAGNPASPMAPPTTGSPAALPAPGYAGPRAEPPTSRAPWQPTLPAGTPAMAASFQQQMAQRAAEDEQTKAMMTGYQGAASAIGAREPTVLPGTGDRVARAQAIADYTSRMQEAVQAAARGDWETYVAVHPGPMGGTSPKRSAEDIQAERYAATKARRETTRTRFEAGKRGMTPEALKAERAMMASIGAGSEVTPAQWAAMGRPDLAQAEIIRRGQVESAAKEATGRAMGQIPSLQETGAGVFAATGGTVSPETEAKQPEVALANERAASHLGGTPLPPGPLRRPMTDAELDMAKASGNPKAWAKRRGFSERNYLHSAQERNLREAQAQEQYAQDVENFPWNTPLNPFYWPTLFGEGMAKGNLPFQKPFEFARPTTEAERKKYQAERKK